MSSEELKICTWIATYSPLILVFCQNIVFLSIQISKSLIFDSSTSFVQSQWPQKSQSKKRFFKLQLRKCSMYSRVGKKGSLWPWSIFIKDSLLQYTMTLLQGPKDPVLPTLSPTYYYIVIPIYVFLINSTDIIFQSLLNHPQIREQMSGPEIS